jgi:hypothetical protein
LPRWHDKLRYKSSMEGPTDEASIPTESNKSMSGTILKRKVCTKTCVTKLTAANIKSSLDEYIPARKKPRLQVPASLPAIAADADTLNAYASPDAGVAVPVASADAGTAPVAASPMQPNDGATRAPPHRWTTEERHKADFCSKHNLQEEASREVQDRLGCYFRAGSGSTETTV